MYCDTSSSSWYVYQYSTTPSSSSQAGTSSNAGGASSNTGGSSQNAGGSSQNVGSSSQNGDSSSFAPHGEGNQPSASVVTRTVTKIEGTSGGAIGTGAGGLRQSSTSTAAGSGKTGGGGSKTKNTGAIAGGVVGGVAGVALIGTAIGYIVYRKRKQRVEPMREVRYVIYGGVACGGYSALLCLGESTC